MRRYFAGVVTALAFALSGFVAIGAGATDHRRVIYITNESSTLTDRAVRDALPAFQAALSKDFAPIWDADARLVYIGRKSAPRLAWQIKLTDYPACLGCYGYHEYADRTVRAEVGVNQGNWQITFMHELFEMEADPYAAIPGPVRGVQVGDDWYAMETADPVEANNLAYTRWSATGKPVKISDFVTPEWFDGTSDGPWDFKQHTTKPLQILLGGYQLVWRDGAWGSIDNFGVFHPGEVDD